VKKRLALVFALILAAPAHAVPIISLHGGGGNWHSQYASTDEAVLLALAGVIGGLTQGALFMGAQVLFPSALVPGVPRSIPLIDILVTLACIAGPRFALRSAIGHHSQQFRDFGDPTGVRLAL